jgi:2-(1,2-epoxy-1,2-dihydrophenyl)acetyl-CoA isomerase
MENSILFEVEAGIATIRLNRPAVFNAFNAAMRTALIDALAICATDSAIRCVLITGEGKAFCAGQDLSEISDPETAPSFETILDAGFNRIVLAIRNLEKPVVAAVNGVAAGAGAGIALACDMVVATEKAAFIQAFSKIGLVPDSGSSFILPRLVGAARATALMFLGDKLSAPDAVQIGLIYGASPEETFKEDVATLVHTLANMPTQALGLTKKAINASFDQSFEAQLRLETSLQGQAAQTSDYSEGVKAFIEKRKPVFKGK